MAMHPDLAQLAAYLDGALDATARAAVRAHLLTCPDCAARHALLRGDSQRIAAFAASTAAPDVRAAVRKKLRRGRPAGWLLRGGALAGAVATLFLFGLLISVGAGSATLGPLPDRLVVVDRNNGRLLALDPDDGDILSSVQVGDMPTKVRYDERAGRLYVLVKQAVVALDARTLAEVARWDAPQPVDLASGMARDARRGRLYVAQSAAPTIQALDTATFMPAGSFGVGRDPRALALAPDGATLFALDYDGMLWTIDPLGGTKSAQSLSGGAPWPLAWLALSANGQTVYVLHASGGPQTWTPQLWRVDARSGAISGPTPLPGGEAPWDLLLVGERQLAIPRGNGKTGGVLVVAADDFRAARQISPESDQHHAISGPGESIFTLNFSHGTVARYDIARTPAEAWRAQLPGQPPAMPYDGAFVPGGWRWPW
jgi:hypothetical protein